LINAIIIRVEYFMISIFIRGASLSARQRVRDAVLFLVGIARGSRRYDRVLIRIDRWRKRSDRVLAGINRWRKWCDRVLLAILRCSRRYDRVLISMSRCNRWCDRVLLGNCQNTRIRETSP
jgi:hypothetical protein